MKPTLKAVLVVLVFNVAKALCDVNFTIIATNDLHSSFEGSGPDGQFTDAHDGDVVKGHLARLCAQVKARRALLESAGEPVLVVDAGDWFSGSLYHLLGPSERSTSAPELETFDFCGFDATTIGNHDLDAGEAALGRMLSKGAVKGLHVRVVSSNIADVQATGYERVLGDMDANGSLLVSSMLKVFDQGVTIGVIGVFGGDACMCSSTSRTLKFYGYNDETESKDTTTLYDHLTKQVHALRQRGANVIVVLAHMGAPEDADLAQNVAGVDVVIASHTHERYLTSVRGVDGRDVVVVQSESDGTHLRVLPMTATTMYSQQPNDDDDGGNAQLSRAVLRKGTNDFNSVIVIGDQVRADSTMLENIERYRSEVNRLIRDDMGFNFDTPLYSQTKAGGALWTQQTTEFQSATVVYSLLLNELNDKHVGGRVDTTPVDLYLGVLGFVRWQPVAVGPDEMINLQFSDVFRMLSYGYSTDDWSPGSPVRFMYLRKWDLWILFELGEFVRKFVAAEFYLVPDAGLEFSYRRFGVPLVNRMVASLHGKPYAEWPELIHIACVDMMANLLYRTNSYTLGMFPVVPRDRHGVPIPEDQLAAQSGEFPKTHILLASQLMSHPSNELRSRPNDNDIDNDNDIGSN